MFFGTFSVGLTTLWRIYAGKTNFVGAFAVVNMNGVAINNFNNLAYDSGDGCINIIRLTTNKCKKYCCYKE